MYIKITKQNILSYVIILSVAVLVYYCIRYYYNCINYNLIYIYIYIYIYIFQIYNLILILLHKNILKIGALTLYRYLKVANKY